MRIEIEMSGQLLRAAENYNNLLVAVCASATLWIGDTEVDKLFGC